MSQIDKPKLKVSRRGLELIKSFEGFRPRAERLADGRWVVGHGHTLSAREGATVDATEAELLLQYDLLPILNAIAERVDLPLNPHQVDALASFGQALGLERFLASEVLVWVNAGEPGDAARALGACDSPPLTPAPDPAARRRAAESALFQYDPEQEADLAALMAAPVVTRAPEAAADHPAEPQPEIESHVAAEPETVDDARALAVATLLGETPADAPDAPEAEPESAAPAEQAPVEDPGEEPAVEEAPVVMPTFTTPVEAEPEASSAPVMAAANENGDEPHEATVDPAPPPVAAMAMAMQRYSPYAVPVGASLHVFGEAPAAPAPAAGPGEGVLILTPPPDVEPEPPTREVWPEAERPVTAVEAEPLFMEDPLLRAGGQPVFMPESFEPERRGRLDWSETGAFLGMGAVGLTAFGAAVVGFTMAADRPGASGLDQTTIAAGVLAVIGALCVGISAYNLYLRRGGRGEG
ncbi:glycoside hydrolase family protein [Brevundimonas sp.]|uniref:glycoside hydrolase family protein n=1 Tax=Brevundimonas sp. TaxID=1871086 RepID=UPI003918987F